MWRVGGNVALMKLAEVAAGVIEFVLLHLGNLTLGLQHLAIPTLHQSYVPADAPHRRAHWQSWS